MKYIKFVLIGILFGIVMTKSEAVSWYRIQEMFRFDSFHMYGIIGTALFFGVIMTQIIKRYKVKNMYGEVIEIKDKEKGFSRHIIGGTIFGLGWAISGACPGPMYTLIGNGYLIFIVVIISALLGTFTYGVLKDKLPH